MVIVFVLEQGVDSYDAHSAVDSVHQSAESAWIRAKMVWAECHKKLQLPPLDQWEQAEGSFVYELNDLYGFSILKIEVDDLTSTKKRD